MMQGALHKALAVAAIWTAAAASPALAEAQTTTIAERVSGPVTGLPLPRFVSLKFDKVRLRRGPGLEHRIMWEYRKRRGMPVEITAEVDHWRRIRDIDGDEGWVHASQLSARRGAIVKGPGAEPLRRAPAFDAAPVAMVEPKLIGRIRRCRGDWCRIQFRGHTGWLSRDVLWGLYPDEEGID